MVVLGLLLSAYSFSEPYNVAHHQQEIQDYNRILHGWQIQARLQIAFVIAVFTFGALITIFQGMNKGWSKPVTLILGALTTILTGVNAKVFSADYRMLQRSVVDGRDLVDTLDSIVGALDEPNADVKGLEEQWLSTKTKFNGLQ